ncbi:hydrolase [Paraferrimonas haliotis]|uniref:hydrolase n=1 Tax=Paraferrimonas haliotis TaxID=2013866 RepID=UPI000BA93805|nr:hydrolase [Paraferrimonas haliotis]
MSSGFTPAWWAKSPHTQTIIPLLTQPKPIPLQQQRLDTDDGDFIDLEWLARPEANKPIVLILHGLEGSARSHYAKRLLLDCQKQQLSAVVHHHRNCSLEPNRLARSYHSGDTQDLALTVAHLNAHYPNNPILAVGYSLGANVLIKYLGERRHDSGITRAVAVSAPLQLSACAKRLEKGFSKVYQSYLIKQLQQRVRQKLAQPQLAKKMPLSLQQVDQLKTFYQFDDQVTAPLHGFKDVHDYYQQASGLPYLKSIEIPTLVLHAQDDPFMNQDVIPTSEQLSQQVNYQLCRHGGHVGFIEGGKPWAPKFFLERRILHFLMDN